MADSEKHLSNDQQQLSLDSHGESQNQSKPLPPPKEIIASKVTGTVKWFNVKSGYGFINRNDTKEDVFVHQSAIVKNNPKKAVRSVGDGEVVEFDVVIGEKGNEAANVTGPSGEPVRGSQFAADKRKMYRPWGRRNRNRKQESGNGINQNRDQGVQSSDETEVREEQTSQRQQRSYRRGGGGRGRGRRFNNYYPRNQQKRSGGGDGSGISGGGEGNRLDQNADSMQRGGEGQGQHVRRGGPPRLFFRRNFNNGRRPPRNNEDVVYISGNNGQSQRRNRTQRRNKKSNTDGDQQQDAGQELQNTTTESTA